MQDITTRSYDKTQQTNMYSLKTLPNVIQIYTIHIYINVIHIQIYTNVIQIYTIQIYTNVIQIYANAVSESRQTHL